MARRNHTKELARDLSHAPFIFYNVMSEEERQELLSEFENIEILMTHCLIYAEDLKTYANTK